MDNNLFNDFADEFDDVQAELKNHEPEAPKLGTLVKMFEIGTEVIRIGYLGHGTIKDMQSLREFLINAEMSKYTSKEATGAYSEGVIQDKRREFENSFKIITIVPEADEIKNAQLFNEKYKGVAETNALEAEI